MRARTKTKLNELAKIIAYKKEERFIYSADFCWQVKRLAEWHGYVIHYETIWRWRDYLIGLVMSINKDKKERYATLVDYDLGNDIKIEGDVPSTLKIGNEVYYHKKVVDIMMSNHKKITNE